MRVLILIGAAALAACGNYSNQDLEFLEALPSREALQVNVPQDSQQALAVRAWVHTATVTTGQSINDGIESVIDQLERVRELTPSERTADSRTWGPFPDTDPRFENRVVIARSAATFNFSLEQRPVGQGEFVTVITGTFVGASAEHGHGSLDYEVASLEQIGHPPADASLRSLRFVYANDTSPRTLHTTIVSRDAKTSQLVTLAYGFTESQTEGDLDFDLQGPSDAGPYDIHVLSRWQPDGGAGRADGLGILLEHPGWVVQVHQCWDSSFLETYYDSQAGLAYPDGGFDPLFGTSPSIGCDALLGLPCPRGDAQTCTLF